MTFHCYMLTCFTSYIYAARAGDVYAVVEVLCIHNLDCGGAVNPPYIHIWGCGDVEDV